MAISTSSTSRNDPVLLLVAANSALIDKLVSISNVIADLMTGSTAPAEGKDALETLLREYIQSANGISDRFSAVNHPTAQSLIDAANDQVENLNPLLEELQSEFSDVQALSGSLFALLARIVQAVSEAIARNLQVQEEIQTAAINDRFAPSQ